MRRNELKMGQSCPILTRIGVGLSHFGNLPSGPNLRAESLTKLSVQDRVEKQHEVMIVEESD